MGARGGLVTVAFGLTMTDSDSFILTIDDTSGNVDS